jgi:hypothetical protein
MDDSSVNLGVAGSLSPPLNHLVKIVDSCDTEKGVWNRKEDLVASGCIPIYSHTPIYRYTSPIVVGFQVLAEED